MQGCDDDVGDPVARTAAADKVMCAEGGLALAADCAIERRGGAVIMRHTGGGFRRFEIDNEGRLVAADGAERVQIRRAPDGSATVQIADMAYKFAPGQLAR